MGYRLDSFNNQSHNHNHSFNNNQNQYHYHGVVKLWQNGVYLKVVAGFACVAFLSAFYFLGDITTTGYMRIIQRTENFRISDKSSYFSYPNTTVAATKSEGYVVWSPSCRIPDVSPTHHSIVKFVKKLGPVKCAHLPPLTRVARHQTGDWHTLRLDNRHYPKYSHHNAKINCCYSTVTRTDCPHDSPHGKVDDVFTVSECKAFNDSVIFNQEEQYIKVKCTTAKGKTEKEVYSNMHAIVRKTRKVMQKMKNDSYSADKLSIMFIGIDSISRLNLKRTMPKTVKYLTKNGWLEFKGYNKIDDNTFPNLMAILTGHTVAQIRKMCWKKPTDTLNRCPFIWDEFSERNYVTAYAEDEPTIATFNYHKAGFLRSPTDYYIRPFMLAAEKFLNKKIESGLNLCLGLDTSADYILNYAIEFATTFRDSLFFSLFWMNSFSHNDLNRPSSMDGTMVGFLRDLSNTGVLNRTLVVFLSDHGMRFGKIRETYVGWLEERLPYIYFWVPQAFRKAYPDRYNNLATNADRLTSPFDIHLTLKEMLGGEERGAAGCPTCQSLFRQVPWNRSCHDAGVTAHWCTCSQYKTESPETNAVRAMVRFVLGQLNTALQNGSQYLNNGTRCAPLELNRVLSVRSKVFSHSVGHEEYVLLFETSPNQALFEATVRHKYTFKLIDTVSRINAYGAQSKCINDSHLQKYCYCQQN